MKIIDGPLEKKMNMFRNVGYQGYYNVEVPSRDGGPYQSAAYALAKVRNVFSKWDKEEEQAGLNT